DRERRTYEERVVELVEVPFVVKEEIDRPEARGQDTRQLGTADVEEVGERDAGETEEGGQPLDPEGGHVRVLERRMGLQHEDRVAPERVIALAHEHLLGDPARDDGAECEHESGTIMMLGDSCTCSCT